MHIKMEYTPRSLRRRDVATLNPPLDFVSLIHLNAYQITALMDVLESVFECTERNGALDIDVAIILG
jgi:hypothetical protein